MRCVNCNSEVVDGMQFCPHCGSPMISQQRPQSGQYYQPQSGQYQQPMQGQYQQPYASGNSYLCSKPKNNMVWAILSTVLCCIPFGIYSIILASKVNGLYESGNYDEAQRMANEAKKWAIIAVVVGFIANVITLFAYLAEL